MTCLLILIVTRREEVIGHTLQHEKLKLVIKGMVEGEQVRNDDLIQATVYQTSHGWCKILYIRDKKEQEWQEWKTCSNQIFHW